MRVSLLRSAGLAVVALPLVFSACTTLSPEDQARLDQSVGAAEGAKSAAESAKTQAERAAQAAERAAAEASKAAEAARAAAEASKQAAEKAERIYRQSLRK